MLAPNQTEDCRHLAIANRCLAFECFGCWLWLDVLVAFATSLCTCCNPERTCAVHGRPHRAEDGLAAVKHVESRSQLSLSWNKGPAHATGGIGSRRHTGGVLGVFWRCTVASR